MHDGDAGTLWAPHVAISDNSAPLAAISTLPGREQPRPELVPSHDIRGPRSTAVWPFQLPYERRLSNLRIVSSGMAGAGWREPFRRAGVVGQRRRRRRDRWYGRWRK